MSSRPVTSIAGKPVGSVGYGLMGFTAFYNTPFDDAVKVMKTALENGANFLNAGTFYASPERNSLQLLKQYFDTYPQDAAKVVLSIKGAYNGATFTPDGSEAGIRASVEESLRVLDGVKSIDIFECARVDPNVPIETSVKTLVVLIEQGKIGSYGLSEVNASTVRKAHSVHPPSAVEIELSCCSRAMRFKKALKRYEDLPKDDYRHHYPRFQPGNFEKNVKLAEKVEGIARKRGLTAPQLAIAWVKQQGALPIPGASKSERVMENTKDVKLTGEEVGALQEYLDRIPVEGDRYGSIFQSGLSL
ncbi:hypothetical protein LTR78_000002 [Recurvomyces mirabilis]|uniref:NADP-dependent oxidoreductase domain-containing protein n=1 Tax=Recurvomyces mirabilis TaxID=574656 RepID=A0AAE0WWX4_9PEZI|nr:hypothetical protein LTR78_000002 [Recurvomyces mirabilis]KAK5161659.1 hypothetical protein LTS14_000003 [Recurvomyces mirabilis]